MYNWRNLDRNPPNRYCRGTWRVAESITQAVEQIRSTVLTTNPDESATKQSVVLRMLGLCGWNLFDLSQVAPEFTVGSRCVDYALMPGSANVVFIEVKRLGENLANHQQQLPEYCFQEGVRLAVLTNGQTWWLYLPLEPGSWAERRFLTIDLASLDPAIVEQGLMEYLSRENVGNGRAVSEAEDLVRSRQRAEIVDRTIVEAWNQIVATPDELLVDLVSEVTERICGIAPGRELVEQFLSRRVLAMVFLAEESSLPAPSRILGKLVSARYTLLSHAWVTLQEALWGFLLGAGTGVAGAIVMARSPIIERMLYPIVISSQTFPVLKHSFFIPPNAAL